MKWCYGIDLTMQFKEKKALNKTTLVAPWKRKVCSDYIFQKWRWEQEPDVEGWERTQDKSRVGAFCKKTRKGLIESVKGSGSTALPESHKHAKMDKDFSGSSTPDTLAMLKQSGSFLWMIFIMFLLKHESLMWNLSVQNNPRSCSFVVLHSASLTECALTCSITNSVHFMPEAGTRGSESSWNDLRSFLSSTDGCKS